MTMLLEMLGGGVLILGGLMFVAELSAWIWRKRQWRRLETRAPVLPIERAIRRRRRG